MSAGLEAQGLVVRAGGAVVLDGVDVAVPAGGLLAVLGEVGSGKTTVLEVLAGRRRPAGGGVAIDGRPAREVRTGWLDQEHALPGGLTAAENVAVPWLARGRLHADGWADVDRLLAEVGVPVASRHNLLEELSGGQQQRVAIARALAAEPAAVFLDDPTSELDAETADVVWRVLRSAAERGAAVVVATPEPDDAARCDAVLRLERRGSA